jgi:hypothetical protein
MRPTDSPETSVRNQPTLRNIPEDGRIQNCICLSHLNGSAFKGLSFNATRQQAKELYNTHYNNKASRVHSLT